MKVLAEITVIGKDKTGVIARVTNFLFEQRANIEGLEEQVTRGQFSMTLQASWRKQAFHEVSLRSGLDELSRALDMEIKLRLRDGARKQRFAIFVTKEPACPTALLKEFARKNPKAMPVVVVGNHEELRPLAEKHGVPFVRLDWNVREKAEEQALKLLEEYEVDFVVLARFMKILSPNFVWRYKNKIINIHPSLLPSFPGPQAYRQAYERGVKMVGVTAHFVTMNLDEGPIIAQGAFPVTPGMSLQEIITNGQKIEPKVLLQAVKLHLAKKLDVHWGVVKQV